MTILDKLRDTFQRRRYGDTPGDYDPDIDLLDVAADEIERLTAENERLRAALLALYDADRDFLSGDNQCVYCDQNQNQSGHASDCPVSLAQRALDQQQLTS